MGRKTKHLIREREAASKSKKNKELEKNKNAQANYYEKRIDEADLGFSKDDLMSSKKKNLTAEEKKIKELDNREQKATLNSKQKKRLKVLVERKQKLDKRQELYQILAQHQIDSSYQQLLKPSGQLGKVKETKKEKRLREIRSEKAGVQLPEKDTTKKPTKNKGNQENNDEPASNSIPNTEHISSEQIPEHNLKDSSENEDQDDSDYESSDEEKEPKEQEENKGGDAAIYTENLTNKEGIKDASIAQNAQQSTIPAKDEDEEPGKYVRARKRPKSTKYFVLVDRTEEIKEAREQLPIVPMEAEVMEMIEAKDVVVICGETGSGKTTQMPQFLYEAGYGAGCGLAEPPSVIDGKLVLHPGAVCITQPRRVAAVSVAKRVAFELNVEFGKEVGYHIRYDRNFSSATKLKFVTDGILLKEIQADFTLSKYSAIILDEAHERNVNTDVLLGLLSRIVPLRRKRFEKGESHSPLKLIIMSATLDLTTFLEKPNLFAETPPLLQITGRQYEVVTHWAKETKENYVQAAIDQVLEIHNLNTDEEGSILVFLTGQKEIDYMVKTLNKMEISGTIGIRALPLYSMLSQAKQLEVFKPNVKGKRTIIVSTNIAETSLTIPNIRYVVDCGRIKQKTFEPTTGLAKFQVVWESKAGADQRSGRAGRVAKGHCFRLFSSEVFLRFFPDHSQPEIFRIPLDGVVLSMKAIGIDRVANFPFPSPPEPDQLDSSLRTLQYLGAITSNNDSSIDSVSKKDSDWAAAPITDLGKTLSRFPLSPRFSKMLAISQQGNCTSYLIAIVAALSIGNPFLNNAAKDPAKAPASIDSAKHKTNWTYPLSDPISILKAIGAYSHVEKNGGKLEEFCSEKKLHFKTMKDIQSLRKQLHMLVDSLTNANWSEEEGGLEHGDDLAETWERNETATTSEWIEDTATIPKVFKRPRKVFNSLLDPPTKPQMIMIRQIICAGLVDRIARRYILGPPLLAENGEPMKLPKYSYVTAIGNVASFIHPESVLAQLKPVPDYVSYVELIQHEQNTSLLPTHATVEDESEGQTNIVKHYLREVTAVQPSWLHHLARSMCEAISVLEDPPPRYDSEKDLLYCHSRLKFGPNKWELPAQEIPFPECEAKYRWFAKFFLEGKVINGTKDWLIHLDAQPNMILKHWSVSKVHSLVQSLKKEKISTRKQLLDKWKVDMAFLRRNCEAWVKQSYKTHLVTHWPPSHTEETTDKEKRKRENDLSSLLNKKRKNTKTQEDEEFANERYNSSEDDLVLSEEEEGKEEEDKTEDEESSSEDDM